VSVVNSQGEILIDTLVSNEDLVVDYVTHITGITQDMLVGAPSYSEVNAYVVSILKGAVVVGHTLECDLEKFVASLATKIKYIDVSELSQYTKDGFKKNKLKNLVKDNLNALIQEGVHSSVIDARAALALYKHKKRDFEAVPIKEYELQTVMSKL
jgi:RNA exonuclease 4